MASQNCARCGCSFDGRLTECPRCGTPTVFMGGEDRAAPGIEVLEPEVLESLDEVDRPGFRGTRDPQMQVRPLGCTVGPGCGCVGLPLLALAGVVVSSMIALLWVLSLGRLPASLLALASRARRGFKG